MKKQTKHFENDDGTCDTCIEKEIDKSLETALERSRFIGYSRGFDEGILAERKRIQEIIENWLNKLERNYENEVGFIDVDSIKELNRRIEEK